MGWKGKLIEAPVALIGRMVQTHRQPPGNPTSLFVLRNNDIGDLLIITPLFDALRRLFPDARITAGIGDWSRDVLANNPHVTDILPVNAPWNNKFVQAQSDQDQIRYVLHSPEARNLRDQKFDIGIDVLGSHVGALLLMKAGIPYRLGVRGYRGGHSAMQQNVVFHEDQHVAQAALRFAELLGATDLPSCRPQLFLMPSEIQGGEDQWQQQTSGTPCRIVIGPGGGFVEKCWPLSFYAELMQRLTASKGVAMIVVGGKQDEDAGKQLTSGLPHAKNLAGQLTLRETFAVVHAADLVITNPSMLMHTAAAFLLPTVVLLGEAFPSAAHHDLVWGYPGTCRSLGREVNRGIATVEEAFNAMQDAIKQASCQ